MFTIKSASEIFQMISASFDIDPTGREYHKLQPVRVARS